MCYGWEVAVWSLEHWIRAIPKSNLRLLQLAAYASVFLTDYICLCYLKALL